MGLAARLTEQEQKLWVVVQREARLQAAAALARGVGVDPHAIAEAVLRSSALRPTTEHVVRLTSYVLEQIPELKLRIAEVRRGRRR